MQLDLDEFIAHLQHIRYMRGNMPVTVNGEHGCNEPELLRQTHCSVTDAEDEHGAEMASDLGLESSKTILHIGGY